MIQTLFTYFHFCYFCYVSCFRPKKVSSDRRTSVVVHDIPYKSEDAREVSTPKLSFDDNFIGSIEAEKSGYVLFFTKRSGFSFITLCVPL